jgi:hypothetical protein
MIMSKTVVFILRIVLQNGSIFRILDYIQYRSPCEVSLPVHMVNHNFQVESKGF